MSEKKMAQKIEMMPSGTLADYTAVSECKDISAVVRGVDALSRAIDGAACEGGDAMKSKAALIIAPTTAFFAGAETYGYYASVNAHARIAPDILHTDREMGVIAAVKVDLRESKYWDATKDEMCPAAGNEIMWAGIVDPAKSTPASHAIVPTSPSEFGDLMEWRAGITGTGGWIGLFRDKKEGNAHDGLIAVCVRSLHDPDMVANFRKEYQGTGVSLTYAQHALSTRVERIASLAQRNASRMLYMALISLGFNKRALATGMKDMRAMEKNPMERKAISGSDRWSILDSLLTVPYIAIPDVMNMLDVISVDGEMQASVFDGVICVKSAKGGLVAVAGGDPANGICITPLDAACTGEMEHQKRYFDGGHSCRVTGSWTLPEAVKEKSDHFSPIKVVKVGK
jgi:hypothetical protein